MKSYRIVLLVLITSIFFSCSKREESTSGVSELAAPQLLETPVQQTPTKETIPDAPSDRKVIKDGEISFETSDVLKTKASIEKTVKELNGYISRDEIINYTENPEHRLVLRVPAGKFDLLISSVSENAVKFTKKNISVIDVTEEFVDVEARLKTKKELENRYAELMKKANKVSEMLEIEKQIGDLRAEIESAEGHLRYMKDRIAISTLTVTFYEKTKSNSGFFTKMGNGFLNGWDILLVFFIGLSNIWPFLLILGLVVYFVVMKNKKLIKP